MIPLLSRRWLGAAALGAVALALASACSSTEPAALAVTTTLAEAPARTAEASSAGLSTTVAPSTTTTTTTSTASTTSTTTTTTLPPVVLGFAGDTSFTHGLHDRDPLGDIAEVLSAPDLMLVNLETTIAESDVGTAVPKRFVFKSPPSSVGLLLDAGIDAVALANNHTLDYGRSALLRTLELLDEGGLPYVGAGTDPATAYMPRTLDVAGWRIALVGFSRVPCDWSASGENTRPEVAWTCPPFVADTLAAVEAAAAEADVVVVLVHWGIERDRCPQPYQRELTAAWAALGADLVIGGHPHVLQGAEVIDGAWLVDSTGNFAFPSARGESSYSAIFEVTLSAGEPPGLRAIPVRIVDGRPRLATDAERAKILGELEAHSRGWRFDETGTAIPTDDPGVCGVE